VVLHHGAGRRRHVRRVRLRSGRHLLDPAGDARGPARDSHRGRPDGARRIDDAQPARDRQRVPDLFAHRLQRTAPAPRAAPAGRGRRRAAQRGQAAPRSQAEQRARYARRARRRAGLRLGQQLHARRAGARRRGAHGRRLRVRNAGVYVARASRRRIGGNGERLVRDRRDALRGADRPAAVRWVGARDPAPEGDARAAAAIGADIERPG